MNYRHAFHAGNFADVVKHVVLARLIEYLKRKPAPFRVVDLHAGPGFYDLAGDEARRTGEWRDGVGRLYRNGTCEPEPLSPAAEALLLPWRKAVAAANDGVTLARYPGSPEIARRLAREADALAFNELHPDDLETLRDRFARERRARVTGLDAWTAAKATLPPPERRGIVLADPPYESAAETEQALAGLAEAHRRFANGILCLWYPIKAQAKADTLARRVAGLALPRTVRIELTVRRAVTTERLNGSGLLVVNPPWTLAGELGAVLPELARRLAVDPAGSRWLLRTLVEDKTHPAG